jgi:hypothetical protein
VIVMFALLCAGATLLFLPLTGWAAVLAAFAGGVCLLAGLTTRVDIIFAVPWLVLARADTRSLRGFLVSCNAIARKNLGTVGGDKVMLYKAKAPRWPDDPVCLILADSTFNDYKLVQDPYSMSKYNATAIPPERQAMFGCARGTP